MSKTAKLVVKNDSSSEDVYPQAFFCALSHEVMIDPVIDPEGHTYERSVIEEWLRRNKSSPITRSPLRASQLIPNRALRETIESTVGQRKVAAPDTNTLMTKERSSNCSTVSNTSDSGESGLCLSVTAHDDRAMVSIHPPTEGLRAGVDLVCVIDVSGSMSTEASVKNAQGDQETHGLSLLDVVKHAVSTIIHTLGPHDRLAIVSFHSDAKVEIGLTRTDAAGQSRLQDVNSSMRTQGMTNLWDGLHTGLELLRKRSSCDRVPALFLLTDGQPNVTPPRGHLPMLRRYMDQNRNLPFTLSTFGFGYSLDSLLLDDLAREGAGRYSFIPDSTFVGTAFVHATSNLLSTCCLKATLSIEPLNGAVLDTDALQAKAWGGEARVTTWGVELDVAALQFGQDRHLVVPLRRGVDTTGKNGSSPLSYLSITLQYSQMNGVVKKVEVDGVSVGGQREIREIESNHLRQQFALRVREAYDSWSQDQNISRKIITALVQEIEQSAVASDDRAKDLLMDVTGQIREAFSKDEYYNKWGRHYVLSIARAHQLQECNNFKDPGVQHYGGSLFGKLRDQADDIFMKLPAPNPSITSRRGSGGGSGSRGRGSFSRRKVSTMSMYHSSSNPCFAGHCTVLMADGSLKRVDNVKKGDLVSGGRVLCVVKTVCKDGKSDLVDVGATGLVSTAWHPIRLSGRTEWQFPVDLFDVRERRCDAVYSFALEAASTGAMIINGVACVTLAHGLNATLPDSDIRKHDFWGTDSVLRVLLDLPGGVEGYVVLHTGCLVRDVETGLVCGLDHSIGRAAAAEA
eukprot:TRINITY_DN6264_c1_g1_i1.p1 TRINITY_DN6264_c1_g1~~TRINITY_DN6264_c1_g1_i1.p1  ORF type:complete len:797 (+),score=126.13 TRINITY_DN6264_c1_g1_i1:231-2621(+)